MRKRHSLGAMLLGLLFFFSGLALLVVLNLCLWMVSVVDDVLSGVERWINQRFDCLYGDW